MFTGIVEEVGTVDAVLLRGASGCVRVSAALVLDGTKVGDSIAVNGVCLTVTELFSGGFAADVMAETLRRTNLGRLRAGSPVNLERALAADGRFGGHIVAGHIDGTGTVVSLRSEGNAVWLKVAASREILFLIVEKGSVAIDGVSLTVAAVGSADFSVSLIPHTAAETTLLGKKPGDFVNLENDVVGKYVRRLLAGGVLGSVVPASDGGQPLAGDGITEETLRRLGF